MISHSNGSNNITTSNSHNSISSPLPWWTWVAPLFIANIGTWLSLWFKTDPGTSLWYLPTALGIVMVYWWGPRALLGIYVNALLCAPLWDLPWKWSFLYALPETVEVGLSWFLFVKLMQKRFWLPDLATTAQFLLFGSLIPIAFANVYLVFQLLWLGDIPASTVWNNWIILFSTDLATHLVLAVPALILLTKSMAKKGWATVNAEEVTRLPLLPNGRKSKLDVIFIALIFISIFFMVIFTSIHDYWIVYGLLMMILAIRYGVNIAIIASSWAGTLALLLPHIMKNRLGLPTAAYTDVFIFNLEILFLCAVSLLIGRATSDLFNEITERRQAEGALRESEERLNLALAGSDDGLWDWNVQTGEAYFSPRWKAMLSYAEHEFPNTYAAWDSHLHPEDKPHVLKALQEHFDDASCPYTPEFRMLTKAGGWTWIRARGRVVERDSEGHPLRMAGTHTDITERKHAEEKLRASEERLEILHEIDRALISAHSPYQIAREALTRISRLVPCSRASVSLFDLKKNETYFLAADFEISGDIGSTPISIQEYGQHIVAELQQGRPFFMHNVLTDSRALPLDLELAKQGYHAWLHVPLFYQGQLIGALNLGRGIGESFNAAEAETAQDVANQLAIAIQQTRLYEALQIELTERKKLISELEASNAELERFTYTVSHDLRNPLVTIKGFLGMLNKDLQENRQDKIQNDFQRIAGAADKMDELLSDLLELSRVGRIVHPPEEVDLVKLAQDALENSDARVRSKNVIVNISSDLPTIYGDRIRLREVFENLIVNAAKYMGNQPNPTIEIGTRNEQNEPIIFVKDNGIGIEERYHTRIFALFEKLNPNIEGTGIGLALVKRIIETHGGRVWVESEGLGKGSTFCFTIPDGRKQSDSHV